MVNRLDPEQVQRNERGIAACRAAVSDVLARREQPTDETALTRSDELLLAARKEAARQRAAIARLTRAHTTSPLTRKEQP